MVALRFNERINQRDLEGLAELDYLKLPAKDPNHSWHLFQVRLVSHKLTIDRDSFADALMEMGIGISVHFIPLHIMPYYRQTYGLKERDFPVALQCYRETISLPIYPDLAEDQEQKIISAVKELGQRNYRKRLTAR